MCPIVALSKQEFKQGAVYTPCCHSDCGWVCMVGKLWTAGCAQWFRCQPVGRPLSACATTVVSTHNPSKVCRHNDPGLVSGHKQVSRHKAVTAHELVLTLNLVTSRLLRPVQKWAQIKFDHGQDASFQDHFPLSHRAASVCESVHSERFCTKYTQT